MGNFVGSVVGVFDGGMEMETNNYKFVKWFTSGGIIAFNLVFLSGRFIGFGG